LPGDQRGRPARPRRGQPQVETALKRGPLGDDDDPNDRRGACQARSIVETTSRGYDNAAVRVASLGFQLLDTYDRYAVFVRPPA
jgi:hypothetical protein